jgi:hypothetical protein
MPVVLFRISFDSVASYGDNFINISILTVGAIPRLPYTSHHLQEVSSLSAVCEPNSQRTSLIPVEPLPIYRWEPVER